MRFVIQFIAKKNNSLFRILLLYSRKGFVVEQKNKPLYKG